jgi:hypothetical protein
MNIRMSDESKIKDKVGNENPFRVPEGYFESFQQQLLSSLPERTASEKVPVRVSMWTKVRPWLSAAAIVCGLVVAVGVFRGLEKPEKGILAESREYTMTEDEMSDYMATSFFDEYTLYTYLTENDN